MPWCWVPSSALNSKTIFWRFVACAVGPVDTADFPIGSNVGGIEDEIANLPPEYSRRGPVQELAKVWVAVNQRATVER